MLHYNIITGVKTMACKSKAPMCVINIPEVIFYSNPHFFPPKLYMHINGKSFYISPCFIFFKSVIHEIYYEDNYKVRVTSNSANIL